MKAKHSRRFIEDCADCRRDVNRWMVITESATSTHVSRYKTEAAARAYFDALENHMNTPYCLSRTVARVVDYEESDFRRNQKVAS
jgi:hypothetical protein